MKVSDAPGGMDREQTEQTGSRAVSESMTRRLLLATEPQNWAVGINSVVQAWTTRLSGSCSPGIVAHPLLFDIHAPLPLARSLQGHELPGSRRIPP